MKDLVARLRQQAYDKSASGLDSELYVEAADALAEYAQHLPSCILHEMSSAKPCNCGLDAILAGEKSQ